MEVNINADVTTWKNKCAALGENDDVWGISEMWRQVAHPTPPRDNTSNSEEVAWRPIHGCHGDKGDHLPWKGIVLKRKLMARQV